MENGAIRVIPFDTAAIKNYKQGVPYEVVLDAGKNLSLWVDLRIRGEFTLRVSDASMAEMYPISDEALAEYLVSAMISALMKGNSVFGQPEDFLMEGHLFKEEMREKTEKYLGEKQGLALDIVRIQEAECLPESQSKLDMMRKQMERMKMMEDMMAGKRNPSQALYGPGTMTNDVSDKGGSGVAGMKEVYDKVNYDGPVKVTGPWICGCGTRNESKFCTNCGSPRLWRCSCGQENLGNFCTACGKKRS